MIGAGVGHSSKRAVLPRVSEEWHAVSAVALLPESGYPLSEENG